VTRHSQLADKKGRRLPAAFFFFARPAGGGKLSGEAMRRRVFPTAVEGGMITVSGLTFAQTMAPRADEVQKLEADLRPAIANCRTALETAIATAPTVCAGAVTLTERLPPDRRLERRSARRNLASAFYLNKQYAEARVQ